MDAVTQGAQAPGIANDDDSLSRDVEQARAQMAHAIQAAGLRNDPLAKVLEAVSASLGVQHKLHVANTGVRRDLDIRFREDLAKVLQDARQPVDADSLRRIEMAASTGVSRQAVAMVKAHNLRTVLLATGAFVAALVIAGAGGYWRGHVDAISQFRVAEGEFAAMMHDSPATATGWFALARLNDYDKIMQVCRGSSGVVTENGRHACLAPIWLDDAKVVPLPKTAGKP